MNTPLDDVPEVPETTELSEASNTEANTKSNKRWFFKDPASFISHFVAFLFATVGLIFLMVYSPGPGVKTTSFAIYGASAMVLFLASSAYHFFDLSERANLWLRRIDHSAIFIMIIGSYIPIITHLLHGWWRTGMFIALGILGAAGILFKLTWFHSPRWVTVGMYLLIGWLALIPAGQLLDAIQVDTLVWTLAGGIIYTLGAVIYALKWPDIFPKYFGFHDVWHIFVIGGATAHFLMVWSLMEAPI